MAGNEVAISESSRTSQYSRTKSNLEGTNSYMKLKRFLKWMIGSIFDRIGKYLTNGVSTNWEKIVKLVSTRQSLEQPVLIAEPKI